MKIKHKIILSWKRILWFVEGIHKAIAFSKEVKDYNFLVRTLTELEIRLLETERVEKESPEIEKMKIQIDLIKKILNYVSSR